MIKGRQQIGTIVFLVGGSMGEFCQAEAVAKNCIAKNLRSVFLIDESFETPSLVEKDGYEIYHVREVDTVYATIMELSPEILVLANSKSSAHLAYGDRPAAKVIVALDSNWLFNQTPEWWVPNWIDRFYILFPETIFKMGLKTGGGHYELPKYILDRIHTVGFLPSIEPMNDREKALLHTKFEVLPNQKLVVAYFGRGATFQQEYYRRLCSSLSTATWKNNIKLILIGDENSFEMNPAGVDTVYIEKATTKEFESLIACADLVVQHHGMGTLTKVIQGRVPVISFVLPRPTLTYKFQHHWFFEIEPLARANLCRRLESNISDKELQRELFELLFDTKAREHMKKSQERFSVAGEENIVQDFLLLTK